MKTIADNIVRLEQFEANALRKELEAAFDYGEPPFWFTSKRMEDFVEFGDKMLNVLNPANAANDGAFVINCDNEAMACIENLVRHAVDNYPEEYPEE